MMGCCCYQAPRFSYGVLQDQYVIKRIRFDGTLAWKRDLKGSSAWAAKWVRLYADRVYVLMQSTQLGQIFCLNASNGDTIWQSQEGTFGHTNSGYDSAVPFVIDLADGAVVAIEKGPEISTTGYTCFEADGTVRWQYAWDFWTPWTESAYGLRGPVIGGKFLSQYYLHKDIIGNSFPVPAWVDFADGSIAEVYSPYCYEELPGIIPKRLSNENYGWLLKSNDYVLGSLQPGTLKPFDHFIAEHNDTLLSCAYGVGVPTDISGNWLAAGLSEHDEGTVITDTQDTFNNALTWTVDCTGLTDPAVMDDANRVVNAKNYRFNTNGNALLHDPWTRANRVPGTRRNYQKLICSLGQYVSDWFRYLHWSGWPASPPVPPPINNLPSDWYDQVAIADLGHAAHYYVSFTTQGGNISGHIDKTIRNFNGSLFSGLYAQETAEFEYSMVATSQQQAVVLDKYENFQACPGTTSGFADEKQIGRPIPNVEYRMIHQLDVDAIRFDGAGSDAAAVISTPEYAQSMFDAGQYLMPYQFPEEVAPFGVGAAGSATIPAADPVGLGKAAIGLWTFGSQYCDEVYYLSNTSLRTEVLTTRVWIADATVAVMSSGNLIFVNVVANTEITVHSGLATRPNNLPLASRKNVGLAMCRKGAGAAIDGVIMFDSLGNQLWEDEWGNQSYFGNGIAGAFFDFDSDDLFLFGQMAYDSNPLA